MYAVTQKFDIFLRVLVCLTFKQEKINLEQEIIIHPKWAVSLAWLQSKHNFHSEGYVYMTVVLSVVDQSCWASLVTVTNGSY